MKSVLHTEVMPYVRQIWRYRWLAVAIAWGVCVIGWSVVAFIPPKYEPSTRVYVNADQLLTPLLRGIAVDDDPARHVDYLQRTLLSRPNLLQVIHLSDLDLKTKGA